MYLSESIGEFELNHVEPCVLKPCSSKAIYKGKVPTFVSQFSTLTAKLCAVWTVIWPTLWFLVVTNAARCCLDPADVARAVQLLEDGNTQREVARCFAVSHSMISWFWTRYQKTGEYSRRPGQGRNRCTTAQHISCLPP